MSWAAAIPAVVGGAGLISNFMGQQASAEAAQAQNQANIGLQKEFAQWGVRWKAADASAAGIHPLYAMGASTHSFAPVNAGDTSMGPAYQAMGQDISRAVNATMTQLEREDHVARTSALEDLKVENAALQNQLLASQIAKLNATQTGPAMAGSDNFIPGQGNSGLVRDKPLERVISAPGRPAQEAGWRPDVAYSRTDTGLAPVIPESLSESMEDDMIGKALWRWRNQMVPNFSQAGKPPKHMLPPGARDWEFSFSKQEWQPVKHSGKSPWGKWSDAVSGWQDNPPLGFRGR